MLHWLEYVLVIAVVAVAAAVRPHERQALLPCATIFAMNEVWAWAAYWDHNPAQIVHDTTGAFVDPMALLCVADGVAGLLVLRLSHGWFAYWGSCITILYGTQIMMHVAYATGALAYSEVAWLLIFAFVLQAICLLAAGGPHAANRCSDYLHHLRERRNLRQHKAGAYGMAVDPGQDQEVAIHRALRRLYEVE